MKMRVLAGALLLVAAVTHAAFAQTSSLTVTYDPASIIISGLASKKGAAVLLVSVTREGYYDHVFQISDSFPDDDRDGSISVPVANIPVGATVVVAVDEQTGNYVVSSPDGRVRQRAVAESELRRDAAGRTAELHRSTTNVDALVVRPGVGSWFSSAGGGLHVHDDGTREVSAIIAVSAMKARGRSDAAPDRLEPNDVLIVVDEQTLDALVLQERRK